MGFAILTFLAVFLLIASGGLLLFYREAMLQRIARSDQSASQAEEPDDDHSETGFSIGTWWSTSSTCCRRARQEVSIVKQRLIARRLSARSRR